MFAKKEAPFRRALRKPPPLPRLIWDGEERSPAAEVGRTYRRV